MINYELDIMQYINWLVVFTDSHKSFSNVEIDKSVLYNDFNNIMLLDSFFEFIGQSANKCDFGVTEYGIIKSILIRCNCIGFEITKYLNYNICSCRRVQMINKKDFIDVECLRKNAFKKKIIK